MKALVPAHARDRLVEVWYSAQDTLADRWQHFDKWVEARIGKIDRDSAVAQAFKPDATAIEEAPVPLSAHIALYTVITLLSVAVLWSIFGTLDRIVVAQGKIATRTPLIVMQPFTTSRIEQIRVQAGDHVRKGQVLVAFDPAFAQADVVSLEHKVRTLTAEADRIVAELDGTPFVAADTDGNERQTQVQIYKQEMAAYSAEMTVRDTRVAALDSQINADSAGIAGQRRQLDMARRVVDIYQRLLDQKAGAPLDLMKAQTGAIDADLRLQNTVGDWKKLIQQRAEVQAERQSFLDKWRSDHNEQLVQARQDLAEATETLNKARKMKDFAELRAPADATVLEIADRSVGSVMREAETLITLVPDGADLYVEANVPSRDISYVRVGDTVRVKMEAYPFQKYGTVNGRLDVLSPDSVPMKEDEPSSHLVYHARVRLLDSPAVLARRGLHIRPGLVTTAEIKTGRRSIASYVMHPILRTADESLREP